MAATPTLLLLAACLATTCLARPPSGRLDSLTGLRGTLDLDSLTGRHGRLAALPLIFTHRPANMQGRKQQLAAQATTSTTVKTEG